ncbi:hypothetical protein C1646_813758 [Rhizophagus diaphanus]|nr:hypothetical protein C1646_813758 [Rhizophagus diaphanus] [Rhizophagus sp. MUCL 43196]
MYSSYFLKKMFLILKIYIECHTISNRILSKFANQLSISIIEQAKDDAIGITAVFDSWTNVKQEHLFGVVLITSSGKTLIWGAKNISDQ